MNEIFGMRIAFGISLERNKKRKEIHKEKQ